MKDEIIAKLDELRKLVGEPANCSFSISVDQGGVSYSQTLNDTDGNGESVSKRIAKKK